MLKPKNRELFWLRCFVWFCFAVTSGSFVAALAADSLPVRRSVSFPALPNYEPIAGFGLTNALGDLIFDQPVGIYSPPGETDRIFIVERPGRIVVVTNIAAPTKTLFLDLSGSTESSYIEAGLLGMAFHPGFQTNGYFYLYRTLYTSTTKSLYGFHDQLSRFSVDPSNSNRALPNSELVLIAQPDFSDDHNAGCVTFGPDGYLYLSLGESSDPGPVITNYAQRIDGALFAGILRIDVDKRPGNLAPAPLTGATTNYAIPIDNPFVGAREFLGSPVQPENVRTEFFAVGLRNPWRIYYDRRSNQLYCGDVGEGTAEEIDLIVPRGNYGWPFYEGSYRGGPSLPDSADFVAPIFEYAHGKTTFGGCVIGGVVYYGESLPGLNGNYFFGDFASGQIWAMQHQGTNVLSTRWIAALPQLSTFGIDPSNGDVLVASVRDGVIRRIRYVPPDSAPPPATKLSATGIFKDTASLVTQDALTPYQINVPFWSDFALKRRWFCLPESSSSIGFDPTNAWEFPSGTFWVKHFDLERVRGEPATAFHVETRILVKTDQDVYGLTYRWLDNQQDAELVPPEGTNRVYTISENGIDRTQTWPYPGRYECRICHTKLGGYALGFNPAQLNRQLNYGTISTNQICALASAGFFNVSQIDEATLQPGLAPAENTNSPVQYRARSFFSANCSQCHQPGGLGASWDARITTPLKDALILNQPSTFGDRRIIVPGSVDDSEIYSRLNAGVDTAFQMPPLATMELNSEAINLIANWVTNLPGAPWQAIDIGNVFADGSTSIEGSQFIFSGSGLGVNPEGDSIHFLYQGLQANGSIVARIRSLDQTSSNFVAGLMLREDLNPLGGCAALIARRDRWELLVRGPSSGSFQQQIIPGNPAGSWLRLAREGSLISADISTDGKVWQSFVQQQVAFSPNLLAGLCAASETRSPVVTSQIDSWSQTSIRLKTPAPGAIHDRAMPLLLEADVLGQTNSLVSFYINTNKVAESATSTFLAPVDDIAPGTLAVSASVYDSTQHSIHSEPVQVQLTGIPARVVFSGSDDQTQGSWENRYGQDGFWLPGRTSTFPTGFLLSFSAEQRENLLALIDAAPNDSRLLNDSGSGGVVDVLWIANTQIEISFSIPSDGPRVLSFYFFNPDQTGTQRLDWYDSDSELLDSRAIDAHGSAKYLSWIASGSLVARITATEGTVASLSGLFLDSYAIPQIRLAVPTNAPLPNPFQIQAIPTVRRVPASVEFFENAQILSTANSSPFTCIFSNALVGTHTITARGVDVSGFAGPEATATFNVEHLPATAGAGSRTADLSSIWPIVFGQEGFVIPGYLTNLSDSVEFTLRQGSLFVFTYDSVHPSALPRLDDSPPIESCFVDNNELTIDLDLKDRSQHTLTLFFSEYGPDGRVQGLKIYDADTLQLIQDTSIDQFGDGYFYSLVLQGHVLIKVVRVLGGNALLNGIFIDPVLPRVGIIAPEQGASVSTTGDFPIQIGSAGIGLQTVSVFDSGTRIGELGPGQETFAWTNILSGVHVLSAVAVSSYGQSTSTPVQVSISRTEPAVSLVSSDRNLPGNWQSWFGAKGWLLPGLDTNLPPDLSLSIFDPELFQWDSLTNDSRALMAPGSTNRIAGSWVSATNFQLHLNFADAQAHLLTFFYLHPQQTNSATLVEFHDALNTILDARIVTNPSDGQYWTYQAQGDIYVNFWMKTNFALLSGLFLDPPLDGYGQWEYAHFSAPERLDITRSGRLADPDADGLNNFEEFIFGSDPLNPSSRNEITTALAANGFVVTFPQSKISSEWKVTLETSSDLENWSQPLAYEETVISDNGATEMHRVRFTLDKSGFFVRFRISSQGL